ncbi:hypothetical protein B0T22DRAFT_166445 [Podospora appendiculata]|uniref:Uncharacterized protein n=1 Tax=Podospora appendiculata TaxID=314037 RepID=A0AAE0XAH7_9PEZI|nr:hypothetical protein B0T22DRAFT_166445 [Podospora appendiculata]
MVSGLAISLYTFCVMSAPVFALYASSRLASDDRAAALGEKGEISIAKCMATIPLQRRIVLVSGVHVHIPFHRSPCLYLSLPDYSFPSLGLAPLQIKRTVEIKAALSRAGRVHHGSTLCP